MVIKDDKQPPAEIKEPDSTHVTQVISTDTVWSGKVTVDGLLKVAKSAKLTITPGTVVEFTYHDYDRDGLGDSGLIVEGGIFAAGSYDAPILFTAAEGCKQSGAWGMILINFVSDVVFDYCKFEYSTYTLHAHFSSGSITNSLFTNNEDGTRIGRSRFFVYNNVFKGNKVKGVNFTDSKNDIKYNTITGNKHGIFLFEGDKGSTITLNNIFDNEIYNFKLGDFFVGDVALPNNYWGELTADEAGQKIFDKKFDNTLGSVNIAPASKKIDDAGIIKELKITNVFEFKAEGFIDSTAAIDEESGTVYFGSYDHFLYAIDAQNGMLKFKFDAGDIIDCEPTIYNDSVLFAAWNNNVYCLDKQTGAMKWQYSMQKSEQDDHRQSSPLVKDGILYIGGYSGLVYALDCKSGREVWKFKTNGAIRSKGVIDGSTIIFGSSDGMLYGISLKGGRGDWFVDLKSPILASPLHLGDVIIAATKSGWVYSINAKTKAVSGKFQCGGENFYAAPISYKGDAAFATTNGKLYHLKKYDLAVKGTTDIKGPSYATPTVYKEFLLAPTNNGDLNIIERGVGLREIIPLTYVGALHAVPLRDGQPQGVAPTGDKGEFLVGGAIQSTPVAFDDKLYFGARDNKFYAIKIETVTAEDL